jgi:hypothetical protein
VAFGRLPATVPLPADPSLLPLLIAVVAAALHLMSVCQQILKTTLAPCQSRYSKLRAQPSCAGAQALRLNRRCACRFCLSHCFFLLSFQLPQPADGALHYM